jgi:hypothetical protein
LEAEIKQHPDSLFIKCFAIKADETNDNGDYFSRKELIKATPTFVGVPIFTNHQNNDVEKARGKVVHSWWDNDQNGIMIIGRVDATAYPQLARSIKEEYIAGTSMGCQVQYSLCSICHNLAETPDQYCSHIKERKTRLIEAKNVKCEYHKHGTEDTCPLCGCKKGEKKKFSVSNKAFEYNYGVKFIENSFVVNPACHDCGITEVIDTSQFLAKVAEIEALLPGLLKAAENIPLTCTDKSCIKIAGQKEIDDLNQALEFISSVCKSMLEQKDQIDLEFLSDLAKVLADLKEVADELTQQGYGRLQSPAAEPAEGEVSPEAPTEVIPGVQPTAPPAAPMQPVNPSPGGASRVVSGPAGNVGTITGPLAGRIIDLKKYASSIIYKEEKDTEKKLSINLEIKKLPLRIDFKL